MQLENKTEKNNNRRSSKRTFSTLGRAGFWPIIALAFAFFSSQAIAEIEAVRVATGFTIPLYLCTPPGDSSRLFVAEQGGKIKIIDAQTGVVNPIPFLDITSEVGQGQGPGILGMTFDPDYATNGHFFVSYTTDSDGMYGHGISHIARFTVSADPDVADPTSEVTVITADQPQPDHDFDWIGFSPRPGDEGNLYICSGDGGLTEDMGIGHIEPGGNAQNTTTLLGKILRIHIEADGSYTIPPDNPFFGAPLPTRQEIFCYGLRNPFRASFDSVTNDMLIGDVGEHDREELDVQPASNPGGGENYGWRVREGLIQNPFYPDDPPPPGAVDPVIDFDHQTTAQCIIGGYIYHGSTVVDLQGVYVFADCFGPETGDFTGRVFTLNYDGGLVSNFADITSQLFPTKDGGYTLSGITSLGEDADGELYITSLGGDVFKITASPTPTPTPTATPSPTVTPSATPTPSPSPSPSPTPSPSPSPSPSASPTVTPSPSPTPTATPFFPVQLGNISTRLSVGTDENVAIGGFIVTGSEPKEVIVRAIGPTLALAGSLADPFLELHDASGSIIASNDNWQESANKQAIIDSGLAPANDNESAILMTLDPGTYTAIGRGVNGTTGIALVEVYDLDRTVDSKLANISTRGLVQTEDNVMIGGIIVLGDSETDVLVRAIGPELTAGGVEGALADPVLELHDQDGVLITMNDDWKATQQAEIEATGLAPSDDHESAILATLTPASYTAIVRGKNDTTGVALVEVYNISP